MSDLMSVKAVAAELECSKKVVRKLIRAGELPMSKNPVESTETLRFVRKIGTDAIGDPIMEEYEEERPVMLVVKPSDVASYKKRRDKDRETARKEMAEAKAARAQEIMAHHAKLNAEKKAAKRKEKSDA